jgi:hypothetical protein
MIPLETAVAYGSQQTVLITKNMLLTIPWQAANDRDLSLTG